MSERKNPVQRRLDRVNDGWVEFAELPDARLLCWLARPDERAMVDAFVNVESDGEAGSLPDLFLRLRTPCLASEPYGVGLRAELTSLGEALRAELAPPGVPPWVPPEWDRRESDPELFARSAASFAAHFKLPAHLALLLDPEVVSDPGALQLWLQHALGAMPANLRFLFVDDIDAPAFTPLAHAEPIRVVVKPLDLDMAGARLELSAEAGHLDTPGGKFRHVWVQMTNALGARDLAAALQLGTLALSIAAAQGWFALTVPIHFALGAALASAGRKEEAGAHYEGAELAATQGELAGDANCAKLKPQARMVRGGLLIDMGRYGAAAQLFEETTPMAVAAGEPRMVLDCVRLAAFCYEQEGQHEKAYKRGLEGLTYARSLDREVLETSTFAYLGEGLLRVASRPEYRSEAWVDREVAVLLGRADWRPSASASLGASAKPTPKPAAKSPT